MWEVPDGYKILRKAQRRRERRDSGRNRGFLQALPPEEGEIYIFEDEIKRALFCECHIRAGLVISYGTIDVPLDAENQGEYRANRDVVEDSAAFIQMKEDALNGRISAASLQNTTLRSMGSIR